MTQNAKIVGSVVLTIAVLFPLLFFLEYLGFEWEKWFGFASLTAFVFGLAAYGYRRSLRKPKCLALFLAMLVLHSLLLGGYLHSIGDFPDELFFVAPFEGAAVVFVLVALGGTRVFRPGIREKRHPKERDDNR